eukprot:TRINITY_DN10347_c0_g1_i1.p1 TRINITY_DN10347_c0_g1~~TRINITY_DN10347_c0_g1_i1.p1  ORF type:complete len:309 (+),score=65.38 TRINITY_DN10347_c0_g1_i1:80-1006(+)
MADDDSVSSTSHGSTKRPNTTPRASPKKMDLDEEGLRTLVRVVTDETKKTMRDLLEDQQKVHAQQIKQVQSSQVVFIITAALVLALSVASSYYLVILNSDTPRRIDEAWAKITAMEETVKLQNDFIGRVYREVSDTKKKVDAIAATKQCNSADGSCVIDEPPRGDSAKLKIVFERKVEADFVTWLGRQLNLPVEVVLAADVDSLAAGEPTLYIHRLLSPKLEGFVDVEMWKKIVDQTNGNAIFTILRSGVNDEQPAIAAPYKESGLSMDSSASSKPMKLEFRELNGEWYEPSSVNKLPEIKKLLIGRR